MTKKIVSGVTVIGMAFSMMIGGSFNSYLSDNIINETVITAEAATGDQRLINQWALSDYELKTASCFQCSLANCIFYASNGNEKLKVSDISSLCRNSGGAWSAAKGTYRDPMITYIDKSGFDDKHHFRIYKGTYTSVNNSGVKSWLASSRENVMIAHVKGHFIALLSYNAKTKQYLVSDSVVYNGKNGRNLPAYGWVSAKKLSSGSTKIDWVCKLKYTGTPAIEGPVQSVLDTTKTTTAVKKFSKYTGNSGSITTALKSIDAQSSFAYRTKIYNANPDLVKKYGKTYSGTKEQNTAMLSKLKAGTLIKP